MLTTWEKEYKMRLTVTELLIEYSLDLVRSITNKSTNLSNESLLLIEDFCIRSDDEFIAFAVW
jgi:hypothetical protein